VTGRARPVIVALLPLATLIVVGAVARWHNIGDLSLWLDELASVTVARAPIEQFFPGVRGHPATAPLDYVALREVLAVLGFSTLTARLWAFAMGVLTVALVYGLTLELTRDRRAAFAAALLTAVAPFLLFYSQEARPYAMAAALAVAVPWLYARLVRRGRAVDWLAFTALAVIAVYTHYFLALLLVLGGATALAVTAWRAVRGGPDLEVAEPPPVGFAVRLAAAGAVTAIAFLPWFLYATRGQLSIVYQYPPVPALTPERWARTFEILLAAVPRAVPAAGDRPGDIVLTALILGLAVLGAIRIARTRPATVATLLVLIAGLIPLVWEQDRRSGYFISERQFIFIVPLLHVLAGIGSVALADLVGNRLASWPRPGRPPALDVRRAAPFAVVLAILVLAAVPGLRRVYGGTFRPKEDWRGASAYVAKAVCPGGSVYTNVGPGFTYGVGLYAPQLLPRAVYLAERSFNEFLVDILRRYPITNRDTVVVFRERSGVYVPGRGDIKTVTDYLYSLGLRAHDFTPRVRVFTAPGGCPRG
jgi:hypothetical protein